MIWYAFFMIFVVAAYATSGDAKVEELIIISVSALIAALAMPLAWKIFVRAIKIFAKIIWFFIKAPFAGSNDVRTDAKPSFKKQKSSGAAKAAFAMSAVALARSSKPSKVPQATSRNGGDRNISCHQRSGNKWLVTYETLHPATGWRPDSTVIDTSTRSFNTWGGHIDITWR
jgi:hypothetical protein